MLANDYEKVELYISCRKLKNLDVFSKSDPQVRLYVKDKGSWKPFGKTETVKDDLNPNFKTTFVLDFIFEVNQPLLFEVVDIDGPTSFDMIGTVETSLGAVMGAKKQTSIFDLKGKSNKSSGKIIIRGEKSGEARNIIYWQWCGIKLMNTDGWFDKSDPLLRFFKQRAGGDWLQVHETERIMDNLNPVWRPFEIKDTKLCQSHSDPIRVECWDWEKNGKYQYIGDCEFTLDMVKSGKKEFTLQNPKKKKATGTLRILSFSLQERATFIDFLRGGVQLNSVVAIDFTGSNGIPTQPSSLHAMNPYGGLNEYQKAISSVCQIILNYDYDQNVSVFGFGGKPRYPNFTTPQVSHCFPCTGNVAQQEVHGLQGIMDVYAFGLKNVELSGPTYFAPLITEACKMCEMNKQMENDIYTILLILTDGEIHDMDQTIDILVQASRLPLSIVIVGVGNADFTKMEILDGDEGLANSRGQRAERDLVQFVPFREFNGDMYLLAQRVLAEVPDQLVNYMKLVGKKPKIAQMVDVNKLGYSSTMGPGQIAQANPGSYQEVPFPEAEYEQQQQQQPFSNNGYQNVNNFGAPLQQQQQQFGYNSKINGQKPIDPYNPQQQQPQPQSGPYQVYNGGQKPISTDNLSSFLNNNPNQSTQIRFTANYPNLGN